MPSVPWWRSKPARWTITAVVVAVVGWYFAHSLRTSWEDLSREHLSFSWWWVIATVAFALAVPLTGLLCGNMLRTLQPTAVFTDAEAVAVQCASWLLKYVPGQVGSVLNKVVWAGKRSISRTAVLISFIYENLFLQVASLVPAAIILVISLGPDLFGGHVTLFLVPLLALIPMAVLLYAPWFHKLVDLPAKRLLKRDVPREYFLSPMGVLRYTVGFMGPRILNAIGFVLLAATINRDSLHHWLAFSAAYVLAGAVGILAVFVPSGLGVREAIIVVVLAQYIARPDAIVIALLARVLSTAGDLVIAGIYVVVRRTVPQEFRP